MSVDARPIILTIDDDPVILRSLATTLRAEYSLRPFTSGPPALKYLTEQNADLILLDYQMPGLTGFEVLEQLQANPATKGIPIIFLTGTIDAANEVEALERGAVDYIQKPIKPQTLLTRVKLQLELQSHRKHLEALVENKTKDLNEAYNALKLREDITLNLMARMTDLRDPDTGCHIERTTEYVHIMVGDLLQNPFPEYTISFMEAENIAKSAKLHDLGKIAMPDRILLNPGKLNQEEINIIRMHPVHGERLLSELIHQLDDPFLHTARDIAYAHHERWDGKGYPRGLKEKEIPLSARIVAIADVYDVLTSVRPYKSSISHEEAMEIIARDSGTHFDPYLVTVFKRHAEEVKTVSHQLGRPPCRYCNYA